MTILLILLIAIGAAGNWSAMSRKRGVSVEDNLEWHSWLILVAMVAGFLASDGVTLKLTFVLLGVTAFLLPFLAQLLAGYGIRPIQYWLTTISPRWIAFDAGKHRLSDDDAQALETAVAAFERLGFVRRGRVVYQAGGGTVVSEALDHGEGREWAAISMQLAKGGARIGEPSAGLVAQFADETTLLVVNEPWPYPFDDTAGETRWRLPSIKEPELLLRIFRLLIQRRGEDSVRPRPLTEPVHERASRRLLDTYHALAKIGYFTFNAAAGTFRPTLLGAYRVTFASLPPARSRRHRRDLERERALLDELGIQVPKPGTEPGEPDAQTRKSSIKDYFDWQSMLTGGLAVSLLLYAFRDSGPTIGRGPEAKVNVPASLAIPDSFADAVHVLETVTGSRSHPLIGSRGGFGVSTVGAAIYMRSDSAAGYVRQLQQAFAAKGMFLFRTTEVEPSPGVDALALYPGTDPYVVMRAMGTDAANYGMDTEEVIAWFTREAPRYPIRFEAIGLDYVRGTILGDMPDATAFAKRFIEFCPDLESYGRISARRLGREFKKDRALYCWWD
jgi:uncharacterized protein DUF4253